MVYFRVFPTKKGGVSPRKGVVKRENFSDTRSSYVRPICWQIALPLVFPCRTYILDISSCHIFVNHTSSTIYQPAAPSLLYGKMKILAIGEHVVLLLIIIAAV